jgi:D-alanine-D-alanine ligase
MKKKKFGKVGVLMGGPSSERPVSLKSGSGVVESLKSAGLDVVAIDITSADKEAAARIIRAENISCAFVALHGSFGEDGSIQEVLDRLDIPYTSSGAKASRLAMDKIAAKQAFAEHGLPVPRHIVAVKGQPADAYAGMADFGLPWVIKPAANGSSIGMSIIDSPDELQKALGHAFEFEGRALIEEYIEGRELTVGILRERPLPVIEIVPKKRFFDFEAKYTQGMTEYIVPAVLADDVASEIRQLALQAHNILGCFGCSRVDFIYSKRGIPYILEVNTIPGLTATSLLPKAARLEGIDYTRLCLALLESAYEKK